MCAETPIFRWNFNRWRSCSVRLWRGGGGDGSGSVEGAGFNAAAEEATRLPQDENHCVIVGAWVIGFLRRHDGATARPSISMPGLFQTSSTWKLCKTDYITTLHKRHKMAYMTYSWFAYFKIQNKLNSFAPSRNDMIRDRNGCCAITVWNINPAKRQYKNREPVNLQIRQLCKTVSFDKEQQLRC